MPRAPSPRAFRLAGLVGLAFFAAVALDLAFSGAIVRGEPAAGAAMRGIGGEAFARAVSFLGEWTVALPALAGLAVLLAVRGRPRTAGVVVGAALVGEAASFLLKLAFARPRPPGAEASGFAFPSGHATRAAVVATLAVLVAREHPRAAFAAGVAWVALVAASRLVLGAHYLADVLAGAGLGLAVAGLLGGWGPAHSES